MDPPIVIVTKKGRPSVDPEDDSVQVGVTLPLKQFDDFCERARREGVSVPEIIRRDLKKSNK